VIDYLISTIDLFNYVDKFIISNFNEYSDHASLHVEFLVRNVSENSNTNKVNDDNKGDSRKLFRWNDEYKLQCREELHQMLINLIFCVKILILNHRKISIILCMISMCSSTV
jgi:hypothetical protein